MEVIHFKPMKQLMEVTYKFRFSALQHMIQVLATDGYYQFNIVDYSLRKWHIEHNIEIHIEHNIETTVIP
jgi:hypothetical protein